MSIGVSDTWCETSTPSSSILQRWEHWSAEHQEYSSKFAQNYWRLRTSLSSAGNDVDGIYRLMHSDLEGPANTHACVGAGVGNPEYVTVKELVDIVTEVSSKRTNVAWVKGPVGVQSRNFSNARICSTGWQARFPLVEGIKRTVPWIEAREGRAAKVAWPRRPGLIDKLACVVAYRSGATDKATLGCRCRRAARRSIIRFAWSPSSGTRQ